MSDELIDNVARAIFSVMKPSHMTMENWDRGAILGDGNAYRKQIMTAARMAIQEMPLFEENSNE